MGVYTKGMVEEQIFNYGEKFGYDFDGKTIGECITIIRDECPMMHSSEELISLAENNIKLMEDEFGYKALRLFYYDYINKDSLLQSYTGEDCLQMKYYKLLKDLHKYHQDLLDGEITLILDYFLYTDAFREVYFDKYGVLNYDYNNNRLYSILKVIHLSYYNPKVIDTLSEYLEHELYLCGDNYYVHHNLKDLEVLKVLCEHVFEENFDESVVYFAKLFNDFDGYGNEYNTLDYTSSWEEPLEDGSVVNHWRISFPQSSINDYDEKRI